jgi:hypothetical protein
MRFPDPQRSRVVLIGTSGYQDKKLPDLPAVRRNVRDLAAVLTDPRGGIVPGAHCDVVLDNGDSRLIDRQLRGSAGQAEDLLLVYYSGHGLIGGRRHDLYLGLPDSEWAGPEFNSLEFERLRNAVLDSAAVMKVIILDCCFSGRAATEGIAASGPELLDQIEVAGSYVLASSQRDQVSLALPGEEYTAFTGRLIEMLRDGLQGGPEILTIEDLYRQLASEMRAIGLPEPQRRATSTADLMPIARNRAFIRPAVAAEMGAKRATPGPRARRASDRRQWLALGAALVVALGVVVGVLAKFVGFDSTMGSPATISRSYVVVAPSRVSSFSRSPSLEKSMATQGVLNQFFESSGAQVTEGVSAVYQQGTGSAPEIFIFVGGLLSNVTPAESIANFTQAFAGAYQVSAGSPGGKAACGAFVIGGKKQTVCVWFDNHTFGELVSSTMSPAELATTLLHVRPQLELSVTTQT